MSQLASEWSLGPAPDLPDLAGALARHSGVDSVHRLAGVRERLAAAMEPCGAGAGPEAPEEGERDAFKVSAFFASRQP